jgi:hypothetical protein
MGIPTKFTLAALLSFSLLGAGSNWIHLKSSNFEMYTTAGERNARETLKYFEQVRGFFVQIMGSIPGKPLPVKIVGFNSKKEYEPYRLNNFATAFYHGTSTSDDIVLSEVGPEVFRVAVHEYVHLVAKHAGMNLPPWLNEGLAELYSTLRPLGDKIVVGDIILGRYQALARDKWVPLSVIVAANHSSPYYNEKNQAGSLYNEGWALTHMLMLTNDYRPEFAKFLHLVNTGTSTEEALKTVYGKSVDQIDKELQNYLRGTQFKAAFFPQKLEKITSEIPSEAASAFDMKLVLAELQNRPGKEAATAKLFEDLTTEDPKRPEPFVSLGYLAWRGQRTSEAVDDFGKAFALGYKEPEMLWDYGRLARGKNSAQSILALKELLTQEPTRLDARLELAAQQLTSKQPDAALETMKSVKKVTPADAPRVFAILAHAQLDKQLWEEARASAESLKKFSKTDEEKHQAEQILNFLDAKAKGQEASLVPMPASAVAETGPPTLQRRLPPRLVGDPPVSAYKSQAGAFAQLDCSTKSPKIVLETPEGQKIFLIDDPNRVMGATIELTCGAQQQKIAVRIEYIPANQPGVDGLIRGIQFEK